MKAKHTPAPWQVERNYVLDKDRWTVAHCYRADCASSDGEVEANASLIAAAPDLLALITADKWLDCPWCFVRKDDGHADDCAKQAAIAKARGEQCTSR